VSVSTALRWAPAPTVLPRLLAGAGVVPHGLAAHLERWGPIDLRSTAATLVSETQQAGVVGHGGAGFPVATKWLDVARHRLRRPVVVANGAEGEPASGKDALLLATSPHLVLDGAAAVASALDAVRIVAYVPEPIAPTVRAAVGERRRAGVDPVTVEVAVAPATFLAGQESAVVNAVNGHVDPVPSFLGSSSVRARGVGGRPTLVHNVETLAHVALVARFGASWYRGLGTDRHPGTTLLTVSGRWSQPIVLEAPFGIPSTRSWPSRSRRPPTCRACCSVGTEAGGSLRTPSPPSPSRNPRRDGPGARWGRASWSSSLPTCAHSPRWHEWSATCSSRAAASAARASTDSRHWRTGSRPWPSGPPGAGPLPTGSCSCARWWRAGVHADIPMASLGSSAAPRTCSRARSQCTADPVPVRERAQRRSYRPLASTEPRRYRTRGPWGSSAP